MTVKSRRPSTGSLQPDNSRETMSELKWRCPCGSFEANLTAPPIFDFNCHCHSCVAPARYLSAKFPDSRSALVHGGAGKSFFALTSVELPVGGLSFLKVGEAGENIRAYTTCCGTLFNTAGGRQFPAGARPLTRNNIITADGSAYMPSEEAFCGDCLCKFAYDDYTLPEPHFDGASDGLMAQFSGGMPPKPEDEAAFDERWFKVGSEVEEVVPITWE